MYQAEPTWHQSVPKNHQIVSLSIWGLGAQSAASCKVIQIGKQNFRTSALRRAQYSLFSKLSSYLVLIETRDQRSSFRSKIPSNRVSFVSHPSLAVISHAMAFRAKLIQRLTETEDWGPEFLISHLDRINSCSLAAWSVGQSPLSVTSVSFRVRAKIECLSAGRSIPTIAACGARIAPSTPPKATPRRNLGSRINIRCPANNGLWPS